MAMAVDCGEQYDRHGLFFKQNVSSRRWVKLGGCCGKYQTLHRSRCSRPANESVEICRTKNGRRGSNQPEAQRRTAQRFFRSRSHHNFGLITIYERVLLSFRYHNWYNSRFSSERDQSMKESAKICIEKHSARL